MIRVLILGVGMLLYGALRGFGVLRSGGAILPPWFIPGVALLLAVTSLRRPIVERLTMVLIAINAGLITFHVGRGIEALSRGASGAVVVVLSVVFRREMQGSNDC
jgi:hypothetical protein